MPKKYSNILAAMPWQGAEMRSKMAYTYTPGSAPAGGPSVPTSVSKGRMYKPSGPATPVTPQTPTTPQTPAAPQSPAPASPTSPPQPAPAPQFDITTQNGVSTATAPGGFTTTLPSNLAPVTPNVGQDPRQAYLEAQYRNYNLQQSQPGQAYVPVGDQFQVFNTGENTYQAFDPDGRMVTLSGDYSDPAAAQAAARNQWLKDHGQGAAGYTYVPQAGSNEPQQKLLPDSLPEYGDFKQETIYDRHGGSKVMLTAPDGRKIYATQEQLADPTQAASYVQEQYNNALISEWNKATRNGQYISGVAAPSAAMPEAIRRSYERTQLSNIAPENIQVYTDPQSGTTKALLPNGSAMDLPGLPPGADAQQYAKGLVDQYLGQDDAQSGTFDDFASQRMNAHNMANRHVGVDSTWEPTDDMRRWAEQGDVNAFKEHVFQGVDPQYINMSEETKALYDKAQANHHGGAGNFGFWDSVRGRTLQNNDPAERAKQQARLAENPELYWDPRYYNERGFTNWLRNKTGLGARNAMQMSGGGLAGAPLTTVGQGRWQKFKERAVNFAGGAVDAMFLNPWNREMPGNYALAENKFQKAKTLLGHDPDQKYNNIFDTLGAVKKTFTNSSPEKAWEAAKLMGQGAANMGTGVMEAAFQTPMLKGVGMAAGLGKTLTRAPLQAAKGSFLGRTAKTFGIPLGGAMALDTMTGDSHFKNPDIMANKQLAADMGIDIDNNPNWEAETMDRFARYYAGRDGSGTSAGSSPAIPGAGRSSTDANTLQRTGYLHPHRIFNPTPDLGPYQSMFLDMVTPQPNPYETPVHNPNSMMDAYHDSARIFQRPAHLQGYDNLNAMLSGGSF